MLLQLLVGKTAGHGVASPVGGRLGAVKQQAEAAGSSKKETTASAPTRVGSSLLSNMCQHLLEEEKAAAVALAVPRGCVCGRGEDGQFCQVLLRFSCHSHMHHCSPMQAVRTCMF